MNSQCAPSTLPLNTADLANANRIIAECYAPVVHQMAEAELVNSVNGFADLITSVDFDGTGTTGDNWENLATLNFTEGQTLGRNELDPIVYYSVVWTDKAWVITYGFYHPRDYAGAEDQCCSGSGTAWLTEGDNHENDFEGAIFVVSRSDFQIKGGYSISHHDLKEYDDITQIPDVYIDNGTHAIALNLNNGCISGINPCDNCLLFALPHVVYNMTTNEPFVDVNENSSNLLTGNGSYLLDNIFGSHATSLWNLRSDPGVFQGDIFFKQGGGDCEEHGGNASAPWGWGQLNYEDLTIKKLVNRAIFGVDGNQINSIVIIDNPYFPSNCANDNITISTNSEWNETEQSDWTLPNGTHVKSLTIKNGAKLTVRNKTIEFGENATVTVEKGGKLILDASTFTSGCEEKWHGIIAENGQPAAEVHLKGNSIISNAIVGIQLGDLENIQSDNPIIIENVTRIENCEIGIAFGGGDHSDSQFNSFIDLWINNTGMYLNQATGLTVPHARLLGCREAIRSIDSYMSLPNFVTKGGISGSEFEDVGVVLEGTYPLSSGILIGDMNQPRSNFKNELFFSAGSEHPSGVNITNTIFDDVAVYGYANVTLYGSNSFYVANNDIMNSDIGAFILSTGDNENFNNCNDYKNHLHASCFIRGTNSETVALENHFTGNQNINLAFIGATVPDQGGANNPASNCFAENAIDIFTNSVITANGTLGDPFQYHYFDDGQDGCQVPINNGNYNRQQSLVVGDNCSGDVGIFGLIDPDDDGTLGVIPDKYDPKTACRSCIRDSIKTWITTVITNGGDDPTTETNEETPYPNPQLEQDEAVLENWINFGIYVGLETENYSFVETILTQLVTFKWRKRLFGLQIIKKDYNSAQNILDNLPQTDQEEIYFNTVQNTNIKRLRKMNGEEGIQIDSNEIKVIRDIALSPYPSKGYAYSLYRILTDIKLPIPFPNLKGMVSTRNSSSNIILKKDNIIVSPNPAQDFLTVTNFSNGNIKELQIISYTGEQIANSTHNDMSVSIDISEFPIGVYFVRVTDGNGNITTSKFVKQ